MKDIVFTQISIAELRDVFSEEITKALKGHSSEKPQQEPDVYLNIKQTSELLHIAVATLYDYTHKKKIPFSKVGKKLLFSKRELSEWVLTHRRRTKKEIDTEADNWLLKQQS